MLLLLLSTILLPFLSYDALSFRFEKLPVIPRRSSLIARSFILDKSNEDYQQRLHVENQRAPYDHPVEFSDKLINPMAVMSDGIPLRKNSLYRRIEETMEFAGFESPMHSSGRNTIIFLLVLYSIKILRNKFLLKVCTFITFYKTFHCKSRMAKLGLFSARFVFVLFSSSSR